MSPCYLFHMFTLVRTNAEFSTVLLKVLNWVLWIHWKIWLGSIKKLTLTPKQNYKTVSQVVAFSTPELQQCCIDHCSSSLWLLSACYTLLTKAKQAKAAPLVWDPNVGYGNGTLYSNCLPSLSVAVASQTNVSLQAPVWQRMLHCCLPCLHTNDEMNFMSTFIWQCVIPSLTYLQGEKQM